MQRDYLVIDDPDRIVSLGFTSSDARLMLADDDRALDHKDRPVIYLEGGGPFGPRILGTVRALETLARSGR